MLNQRLTSIIKYFSWVYKIYYCIFSVLINLLKLVIQPNDKLILFNSYGGRKYDDSPKVIYEEMIRDARFHDFRYVWAFHEPERFDVPGTAIKIKTNSIRYFITALEARAWITNSGITRGLRFKGKKTFFLNTWHGTPIKSMGIDVTDPDIAFIAPKTARIDKMNVQSQYEVELFGRAFGLENSQFLQCGLPRNDALVRCTREENLALKRRLKIPEDKKVILYAPTFRDYEHDAGRNCILMPPINLNTWQTALQTGFVLLFRVHYEVAKSMEIKENDFVRDMTGYPVLDELMKVADVLISDYSSIFFDFSVMDKVMLHFTYDYDEYARRRGLYFDIREWLSGANQEEKVIDILKNLNWTAEVDRCIQFREHFVNFYGNATKQTLNCIAENICGK